MNSDPFLLHSTLGENAADIDTVCVVVFCRALCGDATTTLPVCGAEVISPQSLYATTTTLRVFAGLRIGLKPQRDENSPCECVFAWRGGRRLD